MNVCILDISTRTAGVATASVNFTFCFEARKGAHCRGWGRLGMATQKACRETVLHVALSRPKVNGRTTVHVEKRLL